MFSNTIFLPEGGRSRIIGKAGAKIEDIRKVSGATVLVSSNMVMISSPTMEGADIASSMVDKAIKHMNAAGAVEGKQTTDLPASSQLSLKSDLKMAVFYTYNRN